MELFDLIVIGSGPGGYVAAIRGAQKGLKTAVIERWDVGGTCLNRGCIPTKSMLHSAHLYKEAKNGLVFGVIADNIGFDFDLINKHKNESVIKLRTGTERLLKSNRVAVLRGHGTITAPGRVEVYSGDEKTMLEAKNIIIATGSKPKELPAEMQGIANVITSDDALAPDAKLYKRILISGGGVIGVEFASVYSDLGCEVSIVGSRENLLRRLDPEISRNLMRQFKKRGIDIITPARIQSIQQRGEELICHIRQEDEDIEVICDGVLVCVGRAPVTDGLLGDGVNIAMDDGGFIVVDENMRTNLPGIYAIGDCTAGSTQLAHAASAQGINAVCHMVGEPPAADLNAIPNCVYTSPEIATVGLTLEEAEAKGIEAKTGMFMMTGNGKSIVTNEERGFIKLVFDAKTDVIIGAHLMCARATDIISELTTAIVNKLTAHQLTSVIRPHPTYVEGVSEAVESLFGLSVHTEKSLLKR